MIVRLRCSNPYAQAVGMNPLLHPAAVSQVHLCEAVSMQHFVEEDYFMNRTMTRPCLVAVKILRVNAEDRARYGCHHMNCVFLCKTESWVSQSLRTVKTKIVI